MEKIFWRKIILFDAMKHYKNNEKREREIERKENFIRNIYKNRPFD